MSNAEQLVIEIRAQLKEVAEKLFTHPYLDALEEARIPKEKLHLFAGEQYNIINSDLRSIALLLNRHAHLPSRDYLLGALQGEVAARGALLAFARALGLSENDLQAYEPLPGCQAYPAYVSSLALYGSDADFAGAFLVNMPAWGSSCGRMSAALKASKDLEVELHRALANEEFVLHYQPRVALATGVIIGVEALVRWVHPERGMIAPGAFIPVAESSGLVRPLGEWVLRTACLEVNSWQRVGLPPLSVAVNLSAAQFHGTDIVATVSDVLDESLLDPTLLELEITETMMMRERDSKVIPALQGLNDLGVEIAVDDFGTGYASLTYLRRFPVSKVKVDRSFVAGIVDDRDDRAIVQAVIGLGHGLNMTVTAEGVETREQVEILRGWQCDEAQGYYFGRPVPAEQLIGLLKTECTA